MPVKNVKRKTNDGFEGVITGLNDKEKEIISKSVGDKYITESTNKLILKPVNTNGNDFEVMTKDNDVVVSFTQNAPGDSSSYSLFDVILSTAPNEDGEVYNIVARFTKDENWDATLNLSASAGAIGAGFDITIPPDAYGNIAMASDLEPLKSDIAKSVKTDTDASLKSLTLPSAKDLKTKDGSSFGGSEVNVFEIDINRFAGEETLVANVTDDEISKIKKANLLIVTIEGSTSLTFSSFQGSLFVLTLSGDEPVLTSYVAQLDEGSHTLSIDIYYPQIVVQNDLANYATKSDLDAKQSKLYRHTITIHEGSTTDGNSICFTAYTASNTAISSIEQLANTDLDCFGVSGTASALVFYNKIHIGTNLATTTLQKVTGGSVALSTVYATYTITDEHGPLN